MRNLSTFRGTALVSIFILCTVSAAGRVEGMTAGDLFAPQEIVRVAEGPHALVMSDLNLDGRLDVAVACFFADTVSILLGRGDGTFEPSFGVPVGNAPSGIVAGDFSGDGLPDLALANLFENSASILVGTGNGSFAPRVNFSVGGEPSAIAAGDLDADGKLDLAVTNSRSGTVSVLRAVGSGDFEPVGEIDTGSFPTAVVLRDYNEDGLADLAVANYNSQTISILRSFKAGGFATKQDMPSGGYPSGLAGGDLNGDGHVDLVAANHATRVVSVFLGRGDGTFDAPRSFSAGDFLFGVTIDDLDQDGREDVIVCDAGFNTISVLLGNGDGSLRPRVSFPAGAFSFSAASGDLNGDGAPDVVSANRNDGTISVFRNLTPIPLVIEAEAFLRGNDTLPIDAGPPSVQFQIQAVSGSFDVSDIDLATVSLRSVGTGDVDRIGAVPSTLPTRADTNRDGAPEISVAFTREDLARLFSDVQGRVVIPVFLEGVLTTGGSFRASLDLTIVRAGGLRVALLANPLRSTSVLRISTSRPGRLRATIFDASGRLLRRLIDVSSALPGLYELPIDRQKLDRVPSGIYFYRVESGEGVVGGRLLILK